MTQDTRIGAHASALIQLRKRSLAAYGIDPHALTVAETHALTKTPEHKTRMLAKVSRDSRALAVASDHALLVI